MVDADVLILVESDIGPGIYLPSKFVDYLWARKPIVAVTGGQSTVTDAIGFDYPFRACPSSVPEITGALDRAFESLDSGCRSDAIQKLASLRPQFSTQTVANDLLEALAENVRTRSAESSNHRHHWATKTHLIAR
jgi:hypothetical protein